MSQQSVAKQLKPYTFSLAFGQSGGEYNFTLDPSDEKQMADTLNEILQKAKAPLILEIESLKKRVLSTEEIQRFVSLVKSHPIETRLDGKPTNDDVLVTKLEAMLKG